MKQINVLALAAALTTAAAASGSGQTTPPQGQTFPRPTPASSTIQVEGQVAVTNVPGVKAQQDGLWMVALEPGARVAIGPPSFLQPNVSYIVTWPDGKPQTFLALEPGEGGWLLGQTPEGRRQWINLAAVRTIELAPVR